MDFRFLVLVSILTWSQLLSAKKNARKFQGNFWQTSAPGELLNELDLMTRDGLENGKYVKPFASTEFENATILPLRKPIAATKRAKRKNRKNKSKPIRRITSEENESAASTSAAVEHDEPDDYDRAYEQFVSRYFNDAAEHYLADNDNEDDEDLTSASQEAHNLSGSIESDVVYPLDAEPYHTATKSTKSANNSNKNCRKVYKKGEICFICKNPRTDEHSETCSYEHSSEPEVYAYETERKFRKSRDSEDNDDHNDDANIGVEKNSKEFTAESKLLSQTVRPFVHKNETKSNEFESNSACIKRSAGGKACYYCRNALGKLSVNCFATDAPPLFDIALTLKNKPLNANSHKQRRIFKRTLSYVFEKEHDSNGTLNVPNELPHNSTEYLN